MKLSTKQYANILDKALSKASDSDYSTVIKDFVALVASNKRLSKLNEILSLFGVLWNKRHNTIDVSVTTADGEPIDFPTHIASKKSVVTTVKDPRILGGSIIRIGDYIVDTSISSKIDQLR
jgi:F-type H+-transporting ATPase subunit delta